MGDGEGDPKPGNRYTRKESETICGLRGPATPARRPDRVHAKVGATKKLSTRLARSMPARRSPKVPRFGVGEQTFYRGHCAIRLSRVERVVATGGLAREFEEDLRLYAIESLNVRTKPRRKIASRGRVPSRRPTRPNERWSMDFVRARLGMAGDFAR